MHGRIKIKTTAEQEEAKRIQQEKKLKLYKAGTQKIFEKRQNLELDEEALVLIADFLTQNPDFYTLWNFRKEILVHLKETKTEEEFLKLLSGELELTQSCLGVNPKSYWAWHHRRWSMMNMSEKDWARELRLCNLFQQKDERNFHCWNYRRFVCNAMDIKPGAELEYTSDLIKANFSNYSAWHYRSNLLPLAHPGLANHYVDEKKLIEEYELVQNASFTDPNDQSGWFYHRWLLGRGSNPLDILSVGISKEACILYVLFSYPMKVNTLCCDLTLSINDIVIDVEWKTAGDTTHATSIWYCSLPPIGLSAGDSSNFRVKLVSNEKSSFLESNLQHSFVWRSKDFKHLFSSEISIATKDVLEKELESCEQLYELEPENKWTLFTSVLLMKAIDCQKYSSVIFSYLERLIDVDNLRANYYKDLRSKFLIENFIETMDTCCTEICFVDKSLSSLHHFDFFVHVKKIDLSSNKLASVQSLCNLLSAEEINLDDNEISACNELQTLPNLKQLSVRNNNIQQLVGIIPLAKCTQLQKLCLDGNPVTTSIDYEYLVKKSFLNVAIDGLHL